MKTIAKLKTLQVAAVAALGLSTVAPAAPAMAGDLEDIVKSAVIGGAGGALQAASGSVQARLVPRIEERAQDELYTGLADVELAAFDDADFTTLVQRAEQALVHLRYGASLVGDLEFRVFDQLPDDTWFYPGHGDDSTLGEQRPSLPEWKARGW